MKDRTKFKAGDRLECLSNSGYEYVFKVGEIVTATHDQEPGIFQEDYIRFKTDNGKKGAAFAYRFKLTGQDNGSANMD